LQEVGRHIDKSNASWIGLDDCGKWNIHKLRLCSQLRLARRQERTVTIRIISGVDQQLSSIAIIIAAARAKGNKQVEAEAMRQKADLAGLCSFI